MERDNLETPISNTEVKTAIMAMKSGKSPGVDGFPAEFYKKYLDVLCPFLTKVLQEAFECGSLPDSFNEAIITLLPKKDKDLTDPANYRPISLINVDCKILSKVLALRLDKVLPKIIHKDQVGFIKNRTSTDNMRRLLHLLWLNKSNLQPIVALSLDAQKAFDRVEWAFLFETLSRFGFGFNFCRWVQILYSNPKAAVFTNGMISQFFKISRSTRQGCSLSPLLFTIFLEPLAVMIREEPRIRGVTAGGREHKLFLYADDILALCQDPASSVAQLLETIKTYSKISGYCINWHKSEAMPVSLVCSPTLLNSFNFKWLPKDMEYLGIKLNSDIKEIITTNLEKLLNKIKTNLEKWDRLNLTLWGKVNTIKMVIAPQINYLTGMIPLCIPPQLLLKYNNMIKCFLWGTKKPRINLDKLYQPKKDGGLSLPNISYYSYSFEMAKLAKHWNGKNADLDWILIEQELTFPCNPTENLSQTIKQNDNNMMNPILTHSRKIWRDMHKNSKISHNTQKYASIWHNAKIKIGKQTIYWAQWLKNGIRTLDDIFEESNFVSYQTLLEKFKLKRRAHFWKYLQLRHCIKDKILLHDDANTIDQFLKLPSRLQTASKWYEICPWKTSKGCDYLRKLWEKDLDCLLDEGVWKGILSDTEKYVREARSKYIQYKIIHRYYYTPTRLNKMKLINDDLCWKCKTQRGTYLHAMWECTQVFPLWKNVLKVIGNWLGCILPISPRLCLLGDRTKVPNLNKFKYRILKSALINLCSSDFEVLEGTPNSNYGNVESSNDGNGCI